MYQKDLTIKKKISSALQEHRKNNFKTAENLYNKILEANPNNFQSIFLLGTLLLQIKKFEKAKKFLKKAINIQPNHMDSYNNLGLVFSELGKNKEAINCFEKVIRISPNYAPALNNLGLVFKALGEHQKAKNCYEKAIRIKPRYADAYNNLGLVFQKIREHKKAKDCCRNAIKIQPNNSDAHYNLGNILKELGEIEEATESYQKANIYNPENLVNVYYLYELKKNILDLNLKNKIHQIIKNKNSSKINSAYANFLLSKYELKEKKYRQEFKFLIQGHNQYFESKSKQFKIQIDYWLKTLPQKKDLFTFKNLSKKNNDLIKPIFIIGVPRCGSTLIEKIIASGKNDIIIGEETEIFNFFVKGEIYSRKKSTTNLEILKKNILKKYEERGLIQKGKKYTFTDKSLDNFFYIELIKKIFPNAKVINCKRDSLSSIMSILKNNLTGLPWAHKIEHIFKYFDIYYKTIIKYKTKYPNYIYDLDFEKFVNSPLEESKKLFKFCDLSWDEKCLEFYKRKDLVSQTASSIQIRKKIYKDKIKKYLPYMKFLKKNKKKYNWFN